MGQFESAYDEIDFEDRRSVLEYDLTLRGVCNKLRAGRIKRIVVLAGAGISASAGLPDFRSPKSGLYESLDEYNLPQPESLFDIDFFRQNPAPFYDVVHRIYSGIFYPTYCHYFMKLLEQKGLMLRCYTQNVDTLERMAGVPETRLVEAHGSFGTCYCIKCHQSFSPELVWTAIRARKVPYCPVEECGGILKPGITFYGEPLSTKFSFLATNDMMSCDLLIVMGTSLSVEPCASLVDMVSPLCVRMLWNREAVGLFRRKARDNYRDVCCLGEVEDLCEDFCEEMGWSKELEYLKRMGDLEIDSTAHPQKFQLESSALEKISLGLRRVVSSLASYQCRD